MAICRTRDTESAVLPALRSSLLGTEKRAATMSIRLSHISWAISSRRFDEAQNVTAWSVSDADEYVSFFKADDAGDTKTSSEYRNMFLIPGRQHDVNKQRT